MFPPYQLVDTDELTNSELTKLELNKAKEHELLKLFGVILIMTKFWIYLQGKLVVNSSTKVALECQSAGQV